MRFTLFVLVATCFLQLNQAVPQAGEPSIRLAVDLSDGSRVIGMTTNDAVRIRTEFGESRVPLRLIGTVRWRKDRENVVLEFPNGDRLTGGIVPEAVQLTTLFGPANISMEHIVMLKPIPNDAIGAPELEGLVLYFPFDEAPKGETVVNRAGPLHGKLQGAQWIERGHRGGAFQFSDYKDRIVVPDHESLRPKKLTICAWVNPASQPQSSTWRGIVTKTSQGNWTGGYGLARYPSNPDVHFFVNYYSTDTAHSKIPDDEWTHLAATYDEQMLTLFVNGVKAASVVPQGSYGGPIQHSSVPLLIGNGPDGYCWFGKIDDVMLFNRALTAEEIRRLYQFSKTD